jgi:hypothetical protein
LFLNRTSSPTPFQKSGAFDFEVYFKVLFFGEDLGEVIYEYIL